MGNKKNYNAIAAISIAILCTAVSIGLFLYKFGFNLNTPIKNWIDTATYFNNLLSPIFLFITVLLLYWTWRDTKQGLELQREDNLFNTITTTFENYSNNFIENSNNTIDRNADMNTSELLRLVGNSYLQYSEDYEKGSHIPEQWDLSTRVTYLNNLHTSKAQVSIFATYSHQLYCNLTDETHRTGYMLLFYGKLGIEKIIALVLIKYIVRAKLIDLEQNVDSLDSEIEFLKKAAILPHKSQNKNFETKLYDDKMLQSYIKS